MPVREISVIEAVEAMLEVANKIIPKTTVQYANLMIEQAQRIWRKEATDAPKKVGKENKGETSSWGARYASTLKLDLIKGWGGTTKVFVDENNKNYKYVERVENGVRQWSIKDALLSGKAARRNQASSPHGTVFVRVPFRYRSPGKGKASSEFVGILPKDIYEKAKRGDKLGTDYGKYAGLVKLGGKHHEQYLTFRTVSHKSKGWDYPETKGVPVFETVKKKVEAMMATAMKNFMAGLAKDLEKEGRKL